MRACRATDRALLRIGGAAARDFLQGLVTNDIHRLDDGAVYAALLTPQGKYLFDFFLLNDGEDILLDVRSDRAAALAQRLAMYRLRAAVTIAPVELAVVLGQGARPRSALVVDDPRHPALGWRAYGSDAEAILVEAEPLDPDEITDLRIALAIPETGAELVADDSYILEMGFERLNGVDFRKGCYVGQEVTARMKHKTELKKGLVRVNVEGVSPPAGTEIFAGDRQAGTLCSVARGAGLAYLRFDRAQGDLTAGAARITLREALS